MSNDNIDNAAMRDNNTDDTTTGDGNTENTATGETHMVDVPSQKIQVKLKLLKSVAYYGRTFRTFNR